MDELVLKVRADARGVKSEMHGIADETDRLRVTSQKASSAVRGFVGELAQARSGADVASAALGAFGKILGTSIAGTAVVIAGKVLVDTWNKITEGVNTAKTAIADANREIAKIASVGGFEAATKQAQILQGAADAIRKQIDEINKSKLSSFISDLRGTTQEMEKLFTATKKQADEQAKIGVVGQLAEMERVKNLSESDKVLSDIAAKYKTVVEEARKTGDQELVNRAILASQAEIIQKNAELKSEAEQKYQKELYKAEEEARIFERKNEEELNEFRKKLAEDTIEFERKLDQNEYDERVKRERELRDTRISLYTEYVNAAAENEKKLSEVRKSLAQSELELAQPTLEAALGPKPGRAGASFTGEGQQKRLDEIRRRADEEAAKNEIERIRQELVDAAIAAQSTGDFTERPGGPSRLILEQDPDKISTRDAINELKRRSAEEAAQGGNLSEKIRERNELSATESTLQAVKDLLKANIDTLTKYSTAE